MYTYASVIALILICEIGSAVTVLIFRDDVAKKLEEGLISGLDDYGMESNITDGITKNGPVTDSWNGLQVSLQCCGVVSFDDWGVNPNLNATDSVPDSCCKEVALGCGTGLLSKEDPKTIYKDGCFNKVQKIIKDNAFWIAIAAGCLVAIQLVIVFVACCLGNTMKKAKYDSK